MNIYIFSFLLTFLITFALTPVIKKIAIRLNVIDMPNKRKVHTTPIPRLGGFAIFISFFLAAYFLVDINMSFIGVFVASSFLLLIGFLDDKYSLSPPIKIVGHFISALILVISGIGVEAINNPFGGIIDLSVYQIPISFLGNIYSFTVLSDMLTIIWVVLLINAINFLDGLDGLATGVSGIGALMLFFLSISALLNQPTTALLSILLAGAVFGFLPYNFHKAKIFLGDSGSMFLGFMLATLAIISGAKLATAALALGFPILDAGWAFIRRILKGKSPFKADKEHLHHIFLQAGLTQKQAVLFFYSLSVVFGLVAVLGRTREKIIGLLIILLIMIALVYNLYAVYKPKRDKIDT